ncbi:hypothetical protein B9Z19DRAFT_487812 [Tuber borchii]|uniref:Uncharacterized protein n=1 Tax=Tuber borchii TaxID=42251 RepID=A0A2T6ZEY1_TUBBO|nr:hypothetical protein B9Z19DRAFT_487812 [Tuber borchii]
MLTIFDTISFLDEIFLLFNCLRHQMSLLIVRQIFPFAFFACCVALHLFTLMFSSLYRCAVAYPVIILMTCIDLYFLFLSSFCPVPISPVLLAYSFPTQSHDCPSNWA